MVIYDENDRPIKGSMYHDTWIDLLAEGGDLVRDVADSDLHNYDPQESPWTEESLSEYLEDEPERPASVWHEEQAKIEIQRQKPT
jgi:hypothetical protein